MGLDELRDRYPWPRKPACERHMSGWMDAETRRLLASHITADTQVILELGTWLGRSCKWFCEHTDAAVICIDHWRGSAEHQDRPKFQKLLPILYDLFVVNLWEFRERIVPVRASTLEGMGEVAAAGVQPDLVYVDASHDADSVHADLTTALQLFRRATIVGHDWDWPSVRVGAQRAAEETRREIVSWDRCYEFR